MAFTDLRNDLECSICLNIYTQPVTLQCGHNFCRVCIGRVLDKQGGPGGYSCPECRQTFQERPPLQKNFALCKISETFPPTKYELGKSGISCTYCIHSAVPAVKSCLLCEASLCDNHLKVHSKAPEHVLCDPTTSLRNRKCSIHKRILEYYCIEDSACICVSCRLDGGHRGHQVETLDEASEKKKKKLRNVLQKLMNEREEMQQRVQTLEERRRKVQREAAGGTERVTALFRDLRRRLEDLEKKVLSEISGRAERVSMSMVNMIQELEIRKDELFSKMLLIEELCNMRGPLTVLQESSTIDLCGTKDGDDKDRGRYDTFLHDGGGLDMAGISHMLHTGLSDIIRGVNVQKSPVTHVYPHSSTKKVLVIAGPSRSPPKPTPNVQSSHRQAGGPNIGGAQQTLEVLGGTDILLGVPQIPYPLLTGISHITPGVNVQKRPGTHVYPHSSGKRPRITDEPSRPPPKPILNVQSSHRQAGGPNIGGVQPTRGVTDILLDVNTASNELHISDDRKTATWSIKRQNCPDTPLRFRDFPQVLSSWSCSSGRHSWDVDIGGGAAHWRVGMSYPSIDRRGDRSRIGYNKKSWALERCGALYSVTHDGKEIRLPGAVSSDRVRIDLDYEVGRISFYDLYDPIRPLHTFTTTFTETLHAGICVKGGYIKICGGWRQM